MKKIGGLFFLFLFAIFFVTGCGGADNIQVKLYTPKTFNPGEPIPVQVNLTKENKEPILGAEVVAILEMKEMDHGKMEVIAEDMGEGRYLGTTTLPMDGDWIARIKVKASGIDSKYLKEFHVEVKTSQTAHKSTKNIPLPDFEFINQDGKKVTNKDFLGKRVVMTFTYVKCNDPNACPILLSNLKRLQADLKEKGVNTDQIRLISVSVDPENDTPEIMKKHAEEMSFDMSYFTMLTGNLKDITAFTDSLGVKFQKETDSKVVNHENKTLLFDEKGNLTNEFTLSHIDHKELFELVTSNQ